MRSLNVNPPRIGSPPRITAVIKAEKATGEVSRPVSYARSIAIQWLKADGTDLSRQGCPSNAAILEALRASSNLPETIKCEIDSWTNKSWPTRVAAHHKQQALVPKLVSKKSAKKIARKRDKFYESREWLALRYDVLKRFGRRCGCCGITPADGAVMHVDHILPRSKFPLLELEFSNMQVLCKECNLGKSNTDHTDWREKAENGGGNHVH